MNQTKASGKSITLVLVATNKILRYTYNNIAFVLNYKYV